MRQKGQRACKQRTPFGACRRKRPVRPQTYLGFLQERGHELHITPVRGNVQGSHAFAVLEVNIALLLPL